jgi:acetyl-CoA acetyltransferase
VSLLVGCANQAGEDCRNVARQASLLAAYPWEVSATTLNTLCGSGMDAIHHGMALIQSGMAEVVVACGVESASRAPYILPREAFIQEGSVKTSVLEDSRIGWRLTHPSFQKPLPPSMAVFAQDMPHMVDAWCINQKHLKPIYQTLLHQEVQASWVLSSHQKVHHTHAYRKAFLYDSVERASPRLDESCRPQLTTQHLARLKPYPTPNSTLTVATMMGVYDAAAAVVLVSENCYQKFLQTHPYPVHHKAQTNLHQPIILSKAVRVGGHPLALPEAIHWAWQAIQPHLPSTHQTLHDWVYHPERCLLMGESFVASVLHALFQEGVLSESQLTACRLSKAHASAYNPEALQALWDTMHLNPYGGSLALGGPMGCYGIYLCLEAYMALMPAVKAPKSYQEALLLLGVGMGQAQALYAKQSV